MVPSSTRAVALAAALLLAAVVAPVAGHSGEPTPADRASRLSDGARPLVVDPVSQQTATGSSQTNNSTVQHEDPDRVDERGDSAAVRQWFERRVGSQLENSSIQLSQGQYEQARSLLGGEYGENVDRYVDIVGRTADDDDGGGTGDITRRRVDRLRNTTDKHREYISKAETYSKTRKEYLRAKRKGNETRARRLARELERLQQRINRTGTDVLRNYRTISNATDLNLTTVQRSIENTTANISAQQREIRQAAFTNTTIRLDGYAANVSFRDPLRVRGTLVAANGTLLANRTIAVRLGPQTTRTTTTANGSFALSLRPTVAPRGTQQFSVRYFPRNVSMYLGTRTARSVNVSAVESTVTLTRSPDRGRFNETVTVAGRVRVPNASAPAEGVPVRVVAGSTSLGVARTEADGSFALTTTVPAAVPTGDQQLRVELPFADRALARANATAPLDIAATPTAVTITAERMTGQSVRVRFEGRLRTENGTPLPNRELALRVGGRTVTTVTTDERGAYSTTLAASTLRNATETDSATVSATFAGFGNLNGTRATTAVEISGRGGSSGVLGALGGSSALPAVLGAGLLGIGVLGVFALRRRRRNDRESAADSDEGAEDDSATASESASPSATDDSRGLLEQARTHLEAGRTDDAARLAYAAARQHVTAQFDDAGETAAQTHWEFYSTCRDHEAFGTDRASDLESLTETFERARFTTGSLDAERAMAAVDAATAIASPAESSDEGSGDAGRV